MCPKGKQSCDPIGSWIIGEVRVSAGDGRRPHCQALADLMLKPGPGDMEFLTLRADRLRDKQDGLAQSGEP